MDEAVERGRAAIERWYRAALAAVDPETAVRAALARLPDGLLVDGQAAPVRRHLVIVAFGKAALPMARAAAAVCGDLVSAAIVLTKDGHLQGETPAGFEVYEASHPIPDERGVAATRRILDLVSSLGPEDVVLALVSGGGSALLEAPRSPVTLAALAATTEVLV
ncbi:MAG: DUF4147 domain-containing protein, partial [Thermomicrobiales bacterium]